jgi:hypothetical protein
MGWTRWAVPDLGPRMPTFSHPIYASVLTDGLMRLNGALRPGGSGGIMAVDPVLRTTERGVFIWGHTP